MIADRSRRNRIALSAFGAALLIAGCGESSGGGNSETNSAAQPASQGPTWAFEGDGGGAMLALARTSGEVEIRIGCRSDARELLVNAPSFRPVGSEERMTVGSGGTAETLVANPSGDRVRGGVTATGRVPDNLEALLSGEIGANYGSQDSGPHPPLPSELLRRFVAACQPGNGQGASGEEGPATSDEGSSSACLTGRDGRAIPANSIQATGTEPFWAARVEGRCVTYMTPDDQSGTRVWTEFSGTAANGAWSGFLDERPFVMRTRREQGCSDGMSDKRYPIAVTLTVKGEERRGCAEPR